MKFKKFIVLILSIFLIGAFIPNVHAFLGKPYYVKNSKIPHHLYVIYQNDLSPAEKTMIVTLQGVISNKSDSQIYTLNKNQPDYKIWLDDLKANYGVTYTTVKDPWYLLNKFKSLVSGYVLYSSYPEKSPSINNACSLAALKNSIAIDKSIEDKVKNTGIKMQGNCINTDKYWAYNNLWNSGLNHSVVIELSPNKNAPLRDYGIMSKCLVFYEDDLKDFSLRDKVFGFMEKDSMCLGWGPDEHGNVSAASKNGVSMVPSDWSYNLTVLSAFPSVPLTQKNSVKPDKKLFSQPMHYVTFIMSDGDNQQWNLGSNYGSEKWYGSPKRGSFNMGFSISPSMYELAPTVFKLYYKNASSNSHQDNFVVSPSGNGYMYPSKFKEDSLNSYLKRLNNYMADVDERYVSVLDDWSLYDTKLWDKYTSCSNVDGIFYLNYSKQNDYKGKIVWSNGKPVVSCRDVLWSGLEEEDALINNINNYVNKGYTNISKPEAYTFVYVHAWSKSMKDVEKVVTELNKNSKVKVVPPDTFMDIMKKNLHI
jgi:hypothetical protein